MVSTIMPSDRNDQRATNSEVQHPRERYDASSYACHVGICSDKDVMDEPCWTYLAPELDDGGLYDLQPTPVWV